jgi:hypothetical protein
VHSVRGCFGRIKSQMCDRVCLFSKRSSECSAARKPRRHATCDSRAMYGNVSLVYVICEPRPTQQSAGAREADVLISITAQQKQNGLMLVRMSWLVGGNGDGMRSPTSISQQHLHYHPAAIKHLTHLYHDDHTRLFCVTDGSQDLITSLARAWMYEPGEATQLRSLTKTACARAVPKRFLPRTGI